MSLLMQGCLFLEIRNVFDTLDHTHTLVVVIDIMWDCGGTGYRHVLTGRRHCERSEQTRPWCQVEVGVPQSRVLNRTYSVPYM